MGSYGSICSGIEAATVAWHPLGWKPAFFAEIDKFPSAVLKHHYPETPNLGDFTKVKKNGHGAIDVLAGGTPCQAFSVAGLRKGLDDPRGNLTLALLALIERIRPRWVVWENVPGVLSIDSGRVFGAFLGGLGQLGYGFAYRILDAQFFGVPQRRRRVFVVGHLGNWRRAAAVLFERHSLSGHPAPSRKAGKSVAGCLGGSSQSGGFRTTDLDNNGAFIPEVVGCLSDGAHMGGGLNGRDAYTGRIIPVDVTHSLRADGFDASEDGTGRGTPIIPILEAGARTGKSTDNIRAGIGIGEAGDPMFTLQSGKQHALATAGMAVRRLTPRECERLQGFPDDYTLIPWRGKMAPDGPRYKALGNSMAVPVMRWIGERIQEVDGLHPS